MQNVSEGVDLIPGVYEGTSSKQHTQSIPPKSPTPPHPSNPHEKTTGGLKVWESSVDLVRFMREQPQLSSLALGPSHAVLELGCGHGLPGIHAAQQGAGGGGTCVLGRVSVFLGGP